MEFNRIVNKGRYKIKVGGVNMRYEQINKLLKEGDNLIQEGDLLAFRDKDNHTKHLYRMDKETGEFNEIDFEKMINEIVDVLKDKVDIKDILYDLLKSQTREEAVLEIYSRITGKKAKVTVRGKDECFVITIGGKRGRPFKLGVFP